MPYKTHDELQSFRFLVAGLRGLRVKRLNSGSNVREIAGVATPCARGAAIIAASGLTTIEPENFYLVCQQTVDTTKLTLPGVIGENDTYAGHSNKPAACTRRYKHMLKFAEARLTELEAAAVA